jgi:IS1 family transposase
MDSYVQSKAEVFKMFYKVTYIFKRVVIYCVIIRSDETSAGLTEHSVSENSNFTDTNKSYTCVMIFSGDCVYKI